MPASHSHGYRASGNENLHCAFSKRFVSQALPLALSQYLRRFGVQQAPGYFWNFLPFQPFQPFQPLKTPATLVDSLDWSVARSAPAQLTHGPAQEHQSLATSQTLSATRILAIHKAWISGHQVTAPSGNSCLFPGCPVIPVEDLPVRTMLFSR